MSAKFEYCQIELTNQCNLTCAGCLRNGMKREQGIMSFDTFCRTLDVCEEMNLEDIWLHNWGEPLLHPDLLKFVAFSAKRFNVGFASNGSLLTTPMLIDLKKIGLKYLDLSLNKNVSSEYSKHLHSLYDAANSLGINCHFRTLIYSSEDFKYWSRSLYGYKVRYQRRIVDFVEKIRIKDCGVIDKLFFVYFDGVVVPCCKIADKEIIYGDITDKDIVTKIKSGVKLIHTQIKSYKHKKVCKHCFEIEDDIPVEFKLSDKNGGRK